MSRPRDRFWVYPTSVLVALLLGLLPLPEQVAVLRPYWLALVLAYWLIETPDRLGLPSAFGIGLLADLLFGSMLGEQALRLVVLAFVLQRFRARLRFFPLSQQALTVGVLLALDFLIAVVLHLLVGVPALPWRYAWSILPGVLLWPPLFVLLDKLRMARRDD